MQTWQDSVAFAKERSSPDRQRNFEMKSVVEQKNRPEPHIVRLIIEIEWVDEPGGRPWHGSRAKQEVSGTRIRVPGFSGATMSIAPGAVNWRQGRHHELDGRPGNERGVHDFYESCGSMIASGRGVAQFAPRSTGRFSKGLS